MTSAVNILEEKPKENKYKCIVRLITTYYQKGNSFYCSKELKPLKRKCKGDYNLLIEDANNMGPEVVLTGIVNLYKCEDGIYELIVCNESRDWETGYVDDYDYKLIPYNDE